MLKHRLIPVLIVREGKVVQSIQFKHTNVIHNHPEIAIDFFDKWAADEIVVLDVSRTIEKRDLFLKAVEAISDKCFVPLAVGGWIRSLADMRALLRLGADKIVINSEAFRNPTLISEGAKVFGSQCIVVSIDVRRNDDGTYQVCVDRGKELTGACPVAWARKAREFGAGELFVNCINNDGFRKGYDLNLLKAITSSVDIPVIAMGGVFEWKHLVEGIVLGGASATAAANILHYTEFSTRKAKDFMASNGVPVRAS